VPLGTSLNFVNNRQIQNCGQNLIRSRDKIIFFLSFTAAKTDLNYSTSEATAHAVGA
jgi:hypothetical protein